MKVVWMTVGVLLVCLVFGVWHWAIEPVLFAPIVSVGTPPPGPGTHSVDGMIVEDGGAVYVWTKYADTVWVDGRRVYP